MNRYWASIWLYLVERTRLGAPALLLLACATYASLHEKHTGKVGIVLCGIWLSSFFKAPRFVSYVGLGFVALSNISHHVFTVGLGPRNAGADRDEAIMIGARALLDHQNPWLMRTQLDNPLTTGPLSFLFGVPFVAAGNDVTWLLFLFWILLLATILAVDLTHSSAQFPLAALILSMGLFSLDHSQGWRLEELSFGNLLFVPATWVATSKRPSLCACAGALAALTLCVRPSYVFALTAFAVWALSSPDRSWKRACIFAVGGVAAVVSVLVIVRALSGASLSELFRSYATIMQDLTETTWPLWPKREALFAPFNSLAKALDGWHLAKRATLKVAIPFVTLLFMVAAAVWRSRPSHPWWYITFAQIVAFGVASRVGNVADYALPIVSAALIALAYGSEESAPAAIESHCRLDQN